MWNHCPGIESPEDIGFRGESAFKLKGSQLWWKEPPWLSEPVSSWPKSEVCHQPPTEECLVEQKKGAAKDVISETVLLTACKPDLESCIQLL